MKKELVKNVVIGSLVGVGIGACGLLVAKRAEKKAKKEIEIINEKTAENKMDNIEARMRRLERENVRQNTRNLYFTVCGFLWAIYVLNEMDDNFRCIQKVHNNLVNNVRKGFEIVNDNFDVCFENFKEAEERLVNLEVK